MEEKRGRGGGESPVGMEEIRGRDGGEGSVGMEEKAR